MKKTLFGYITIAALLATTLASTAQTTFFTDNFNNGSTTNGLSDTGNYPGGTPTASFATYDIAATKNTLGGSYIAPNLLRLSLNATTTSGFLEAQTVFTTSPITLATIGDYVEIAVVFTNGTAAGSNLLVGTSSAIWIGLFDSGQTNPVPGDLANAGLTTASGSDYAVGHCADWQGYAAQLINNGTSRLFTRPLQHQTGTTSANQELLGNNVGGGAFNNPGATVLATVNPNPSFTFTPGAQYTLSFRLTLSAANQLTASNSLYSGNVAAGTPIFSQATNNITTTNGNYLTAGFDGLGIGVLSKNSVASNVIMDISSILISGQGSIVSGPPYITSQPVSVVVAQNGTCPFVVAATGFGVRYQWYENGTPLVEGSKYSGVKTPAVTISSVGAGDAATTNNGYYCVITGTGGYTTNTVTNALVMLDAAANLEWLGNGSNPWDVANTVNWISNGVPGTVFDYGDNVTFDDQVSSELFGGGDNLDVNISGNYTAPASVTVNSQFDYVIEGGGIVGPCSLFYADNSGKLTLRSASTFTGGTIISNSSPAKLYINAYTGVGNGPVTIKKDGAQIQVNQVGGASQGFKGDFMVSNNCTVTFYPTGAYAGVFLSRLVGPAGKTLTLTPLNIVISPTNIYRYRVYGTNMSFDANLVLTGGSTTQAVYNGTILAPYEPGDFQIYNGVISGNGGIIQRGNGTTVLKGLNTYAGGTTPTAGPIAFGVDTTTNTDGTVSAGPIGTGPLLMAPEAPNTTGGGQVLAWGQARMIANVIRYPSGTNNQTLIIGGTNALTFSGPIYLNGDDTSVNNQVRAFQVTNTALTTFSGVISDRGYTNGLLKSGNGILALTATETYTGPTFVTNGTLEVNGSLAVTTNVLVVFANGVLAGTGAVNPPVTVNALGTLAPGTNGIGTLTINNNLILGGNLSFKVKKALTLVQTNDIASVSGRLTNNGTGFLVISNIGPALTVGDKFYLFNKAVSNSVVLGVTGAGVTWNNNLAVDGSVSVGSLTPQVPAINSEIVTNVSGAVLPAPGTNLIIGGINGIAGAPYFVLYQTNLAIPLSNWMVLSSNTFNTDGTFLVTNAIARTNRFYILYKPL